MIKTIVVIAALLLPTGCAEDVLSGDPDQDSDPDQVDDQNQDQEGSDPTIAGTLVVFGRVPKPDVIKSHLDGATNPMMGYSSTWNVIEGVVWHRMVGTLWGTDSWFHAGNAATAYGIGVAATDGPNYAGTIIEWIDPANGHWYGHSSGPVSAPYGDGLRFVNRFGVSRVNPQTVAIEVSGNYGTPLDDDARESLVALTAYFADRRRIRWDQFPWVPGQSRSFVIWHQELTIGTGKICPGDVVMNETNQLIDDVRQYLRIYQGG
jgi:hypothetical protein